jgi:hypothetical protein
MPFDDPVRYIFVSGSGSVKDDNFGYQRIRICGKLQKSGSPILKVRNVIFATVFSPHIRNPLECPQHCGGVKYMPTSDKIYSLKDYEHIGWDVL